MEGLALRGCRKFWLCLFGILFLGVHFSGVSEGKEILLKEAIEKALSQNPTIRKAELELSIARSNLRVAQGNTFSPTVSVGETITLFGDSPGGFSLQMKDTLSFDASSWEEEKVNLERKKRALEAQKEDVKKSVIASYLNILKAEDELALLQKNLELLEESFSRLKEEYEQGEAASFALQRARGEYEAKKVELEAKKEELRLLKEKFFVLLLGEEEKEDVVFLPLPQFSLPPLDVSFLEARALLRDEVENLKGQERIYKALLESLRKKSRPQVVLQGFYRKDDWSFSSSYNFSLQSLDIALEKSLAGGGSSGESSGVGLSIEWSFSPSLSEEKKQAEWNKEAVRLDLETTQKEALFDIREKYLNVLKAQKILESKALLLESQRNAHTQRKAQLELGFIDHPTYLEGELALLEAEAEYKAAQYDLIASFVELLRSTGQPILWETLFPQEGGEGE